MTKEDIKKLYNESEDFRNYVEKFRKNKGIPLDFAVTYKIVEEVAEQYVGSKK